MEETENIFLDESGHIDSLISKDKLKIGEIFQHKDGTTTLNCIHCSQEFHFFTEFTLHIQEHYLRDEILRLDIIKTEEEEGVEKINNFAVSPTTISVKRENIMNVEPDNIHDEYYSDNGDENIACPDFGSEIEQAVDGDVLMGSDNENETDDNKKDPLFKKIISGQIKEKEYKEIADKFECMICHAEIKRWDHFKEHCRRHSQKDKKHACPFCKKLFSNKPSVRKHISQFHKKKKSFDEVDEVNPKDANNEKDQIIVDSKEQTQSNENEPILDKHYKKVNGKFECLTCSSVISKFAHFKDHHLTHTATKNVFCPLCSKPFITVQYVQKHLTRTHHQRVSSEAIKKAQTDLNSFEAAITVKNENTDENTPKHLRCLFCAKRFAMPQLVRNHIRLVHSKNMELEEIVTAQQNPELKLEDFTIEKIKIQKATKSELDETIEKHFECFQCHRQVSRMKSLKEHMKLHCDRKFSCPLCSRQFSLSSYVKSHLISNHGLKKDEITTEMITKSVDVNSTQETGEYECFLCRTHYLTHQLLRTHMRTHESQSLLCSICGSVFKTIITFSNHMQMHHIGTSRNIKCDQCDKMFPTRRHMLSHKHNVHLTKKRGEPKHKCDECGKMFFSLHYLNKHVQLHINGPIEIKCEICGMTFTKRGHLKDHMEVHTNNRTTCTVCNKDVSIRYIQHHMKIHLGIKDVQCSVCGMEFISTRYLKRHMVRHDDGEMKFKCSKCPQAFRRQDKLLQHLRRLHPELTFSCSICNKGFLSMNSLKKHENDHIREERGIIKLH